MNAVIDATSELLVDRSSIRNPHLRLLLTMAGQQLADGSPWVAISKAEAAADKVLSQLFRPTRRPATDGHSRPGRTRE